MSKTLARSIRRIGILPSTYIDITETRLVRDEHGKEASQQVTVRKPVRNREALSLEDLEARRNVLITEARALRKGTK